MRSATWEIAARAEHPEQSDEVVLQHYPRENGLSGNSPEVPEPTARTGPLLRRGRRNGASLGHFMERSSESSW